MARTNMGPRYSFSQDKYAKISFEMPNFFPLVKIEQIIAEIVALRY
jgi:hypothetical protein